MASGNDLNYQQAETAYIQGNYQEAAEAVDILVAAEPENARVRLLRGHVYRRLEDYAIAQSEYESVLNMCGDGDLREYAQNSLEEMRYAQNIPFEPTNSDLRQFSGAEQGNQILDAEVVQIDTPSDDYYSYSTYEANEDDDFLSSSSNYSWSEDDQLDQDAGDVYINPFENTVQLSAIDSDNQSHPPDESRSEITYKLNVPSEARMPEVPNDDDEGFSWTESDDFIIDRGNANLNRQATMLLGSNQGLAALAADDDYQAGSDLYSEGNEPGELVASTQASLVENKIDQPESLDLSAEWESATKGGQLTTTGEVVDSSNSFFEGFSEFGSAEGSKNEPDSDNANSEPDWQDFSGNLIIQNSSADATDSYMVSKPTISSTENFTVTTSSGSRLQESSSSIGNLSKSTIEPRVTVKQGWLRPLENAPLKRKSLITAIASGIASSVVVGAIATALSSNISVPKTGLNLWQRNLSIALGAGAASFTTTLGLMTLASRSIRRSTEDLEAKLLDGIQGNFNTTAIVFSEDEFGRLATRFNQMAGVMLALTSEAQRKAQEEEQKKEDLQRQVIRLLDDVEGAARGDLTVQAEVTADVLGAVADSFNLTIENLREIVQQVKSAAQQVNQESTASEVFARNLSGEALRQAEELAVTLNSVQVITDSIKRVADNAKEAENVARSASLTALKGGDAVDKTVEGILGIRETVAESTRKVKRLAESSQEISKIVAVISQIASRTNMLALNASIEAARAGEAGRGFAIVADEVRQLADRSAKALKEIEQIVRQIQSDTGSVMTAMEEGTQQVIEGTKLAEKAKRSLDDIITVSNRIDSLVQSITADTVEQTETSTTVAQVMQSVEMTAQATSQEAQRVSVTLQNLVSVAQDLLNSVERFRVENN